MYTAGFISGCGAVFDFCRPYSCVVLEQLSAWKTVLCYVIGTKRWCVVIARYIDCVACSAKRLQTFG